MNFDKRNISNNVESRYIFYWKLNYYCKIKKIITTINNG